MYPLIYSNPTQRFQSIFENVQQVEQLLAKLKAKTPSAYFDQEVNSKPFLQSIESILESIKSVEAKAVGHADKFSEQVPLFGKFRLLMGWPSLTSWTSRSLVCTCRRPSLMPSLLLSRTLRR